jgi:hypothetical protein
MRNLFVELDKPESDMTDGARTAYQAIEDYIKDAVIRSRPTGSPRPMTETRAEWKIADGLILNTKAKVKEVYQLPPELVEALRSVKIASDLNAFVFRGLPEVGKTL